MGIDLAEAVELEYVKAKEFNFYPLYDVEEPIKDRLIEKDSKRKSTVQMRKLEYTKACEKQIAELEKLGLDKMPIHYGKGPNTPYQMIQTY